MGKLTSSIFCDILVFLLGLREEQVEFHFFLVQNSVAWSSSHGFLFQLPWFKFTLTKPHRGTVVLLLKHVVKNIAATVTQNSQDLAILGETRKMETLRLHFTKESRESHNPQVVAQSLSRVQLFETPWTAACRPPCPSPSP